MKDSIRITAIIVGVVILVAELAYSKVEVVPICDPEDSLVKQIPGFKINSSELPKTVLIARESVQEIISSTMMIRSRQSFVKPHSKVECAKYEQAQKSNYSLVAPVLIDLSSEQKTKNSFWQFQSMVQESRIGIWNQKTRLLDEKLSLEDWLKTQKSEIEFFQVNHEQIMLQIRLKENDQTILQRIYYDISPY